MALNSQLRALGLAVSFFMAIQSLSAQTASRARPRITGISHGGYFVSDLPKALAFWHDFLGFDEPYDLKKSGSTSETRIAFIKINDHQHIELFTDPPTTPGNMLSHICFAVDDIEQMRVYLRAHGYEVKPGGGKTRTGDYAFEIKDPDGMLVEFVQSLPDGLEAKAAGKFAPSSRISTHIYHLGFLVGNSQRSLDFYGRILGFKEIWRGGSNPTELSWINMQVPDGSDYVEFMLYRTLPPPNQWGGKNHVALEVPDMAKAVADLESRPAFKTYGKPLTVQVGKNGKRQVNLYDPDSTRIELMEPYTADGKSVPPSTAPPPPPSHD